MLGILATIAGFIILVGVVIGVLIFGIGMLGTILVIGIKIGVCLIPVGIALLLFKVLFGI